MSEINLPKLKARIKLFQIIYLVLFIASIVEIVLQSPVLLWGVTLGAAVALRIFVTAPMTTKYQEAKDLQAKNELSAERELMLKKIEESVKIAKAES